VRSWTWHLARLSPPAVLLGAALGLGALALPELAHAQEGCSGTYASDQLVLDVQELERSVIDQDDKAAIATAVKVRNNLACVEQRLPLGFLGRVYRGLAGAYYVGGDRKTAETWYRTALEIDRTFRYGVEDLPGDHPLRMVYASMLQAEEEDAIPVTGKAFQDGGEWFLDGRRVEAPTARPGRPHVLQRDYEGTVQTWLMEGNGFPSQALQDGKNLAEDGRRRRNRDRSKYDVDVQHMGQGAVIVQRSQPPEQIPLIVAGSTLIAASVGLTAGSYFSKRHFTTIEDSEEDLARAQQTTNRLALGAMATAALGAGSLTYGIAIGQEGRRFGGAVRGRW